MKLSLAEVFSCASFLPRFLFFGSEFPTFGGDELEPLLVFFGPDNVAARKDLFPGMFVAVEDAGLSVLKENSEKLNFVASRAFRCFRVLVWLEPARV